MIMKKGGTVTGYTIIETLGRKWDTLVPCMVVVADPNTPK